MSERDKPVPPIQVAGGDWYYRYVDDKTWEAEWFGPYRSKVAAAASRDARARVGLGEPLWLVTVSVPEPGHQPEKHYHAGVARVEVSDPGSVLLHHVGGGITAYSPAGWQWCRSVEDRPCSEPPWGATRQLPHRSHPQDAQPQDATQ